jgi:hypothetical protein
MSTSTGALEIPILLSGKTPENHSENLGSQNYAQTPRAVVAGGGFDDEAFMTMKKASDGVVGTEKVPWLKLGEF